MKMLMSILLLVTIASCQKTQVKNKAQEKVKKVYSEKPVMPENNNTLASLSKETVVLETVHGAILIKFYPNAAPNTVKRISELIKKGFYNGLKFHRVIPNFVAQGGDPQGNGTGGSGVKIKAEFNKLKHDLGTLAMARSSDPNSADSQFYICLARLPHLDDNYTVFGKVISGIEAVKMIKPNDRMEKVYFKK